MGRSSSAWLQLHPALAARAAAAAWHRALEGAHHPFKKAAPAFHASTLREKERSCIFLAKLKAGHPSLGCPGWGPHPRHPPAAAGQLRRSPLPAGWLPSKEQQEKSWLLLGKGSQRQGRAGRESHAFPMLQRTILASIPVIAATCWLPQPSPPSPRSPSPLLGLLYSPPRARHAFHLLL